MWYYENRKTPYTLNTYEWKTVSTYAKQKVGTSYQKNRVTINGQSYYANSIDFYDAGADLKFSYGTATVYFDLQGQPVGMKDTYDFNKGDRSMINEGLTTVIRTIGNTGGFDLVYGIH